MLLVEAALIDERSALLQTQIKLQHSQQLLSDVVRETQKLFQQAQQETDRLQALEMPPAESSEDKRKFPLWRDVIEVVVAGGIVHRELVRKQTYADDTLTTMKDLMDREAKAVSKEEEELGHLVLTVRFENQQENEGTSKLTSEHPLFAHFPHATQDRITLIENLWDHIQRVQTEINIVADYHEDSFSHHCKLNNPFVLMPDLTATTRISSDQELSICLSNDCREDNKDDYHVNALETQLRYSVTVFMMELVGLCEERSQRYAMQESIRVNVIGYFKQRIGK